MAAHFTKHGERTPRALLEYLAVHQPKLTVAEFASVLKKKLNREMTLSGI